MTTITDDKAQLSSFYKEGVIKVFIFNQGWVEDAIIELKPDDPKFVPPNAYWHFKNESYLMIEMSKTLDPDLPKANGLIRFKPPATKSRIPFRIQKVDKDPVPQVSSWIDLPDGFHYVTAEAVFWDADQVEENRKAQYEMSDKDWLGKLASGALNSSYNHISPREFGLDMGMEGIAEVVTKSRTANIAKSLKSLHLWALAIMVIGLLMLILLTAGGA